MIDFVSSGIIGLLYTLVVGPLTEGVASAVAHGLYPTVPSALEVHEYTSLQQHVRPFELLLLAGALWWGLNQFSASGELTRIDTASGLPNELESEVEATTQEVAFKPVIISMAKAVSVTAGYLLVLVTMLSFLEPEGVGWTIAAISAALGATTLALILIHRATQHGFMTVFGKKSLIASCPRSAAVRRCGNPEPGEPAPRRPRRTIRKDLFPAGAGLQACVTTISKTSAGAKVLRLR